MTEVGVVLVLLGAALLVAEAHLPTYGALGGVGTATLVAGAVLALGGAGAGLAVTIAVGAAGGVAAGAFVGLAAHKGVAARNRRVASGAEGLLGHMGTARRWRDVEGQVYVDGALWSACRSAAENDELQAGDRVVVEGVDGLTLRVRKAEDWELVR